MTSGTDEDGHFITQSLVWASVAAYDPKTYLRLRLTLNDFEGSVLGPGVFIQPNVDVRTPLRYELKQPGFLSIGFRKEYRLDLFDLQDLTPLTEYRIKLYSPNWTAETDNAELTLTYERPEPGCDFLCGIEYEACRLYDGEWGVQPIPGLYTWPTLPGENRCYVGQLHWIPVVFR